MLWMDWRTACWLHFFLHLRQSPLSTEKVYTAKQRGQFSIMLKSQKFTENFTETDFTCCLHDVASVQRNTTNVKINIYGIKAFLTWSQWWALFDWGHSMVEPVAILGRLRHQGILTDCRVHRFEWLRRQNKLSAIVFHCWKQSSFSKFSKNKLTCWDSFDGLTWFSVGARRLVVSCSVCCLSNELLLNNFKILSSKTS